MTAAEEVLRLDAVWKSYGQAPVLRGIDLTVHTHEVVALIGASGSGKSTLLRTINLLETVDDGQVFLRGRDISDPRTRVDAVRARIGIVFQNYNLFPHLSVLDNVTLASRQVLGIRREPAEEKAMRVLDSVGLADKARDYPDRLSGGQQQRVAIARAVVTDPELLLLDEITSALDPELVAEVLDLVRVLKLSGTTIVMATHEMAFARDIADRIVFLDGGVVVEEGPPSQVFGSPTVARTREFLSRFRERGDG
ncbi:MAG: amino acid ABC transporter ATP-binding protein [Mycetocola sp.]